MYGEWNWNTAESACEQGRTRVFSFTPSYSIAHSFGSKYFSYAIYILQTIHETLGTFSEYNPRLLPAFPLNIKRLQPRIKFRIKRYSRMTDNVQPRRRGCKVRSNGGCYPFYLLLQPFLQGKGFALQRLGKETSPLNFTNSEKQSLVMVTINSSLQPLTLPDPSYIISFKTLAGYRRMRGRANYARSSPC